MSLVEKKEKGSKLGSTLEMSNPSLKGAEEKAGGGGAKVKRESLGRRRPISLMDPTLMEDQESIEQRVRGAPK